MDDEGKLKDELIKATCCHFLGVLVTTAYIWGKILYDTLQVF